MAKKSDSDTSASQQAIALLGQATELLAQATSLLGGEAAPAAADSQEEISLPNVDEVAELSKEDAFALAEKLHISVDGVKLGRLKAGLTVLAKIASGADLDSDVDEPADLVELLGLPEADDDEAAVEAISEWLNALAGGGEAAATEAPAAAPGKSKKSKPADDADDADDDSEADEADQSDEEADADDGVDRAALAKALKVIPKDAEARLKAFNDAAPEGSEIEYKKGDAKSIAAAYRKLYAELIDGEGNPADWGTVYVRNGSGWSCGLPLDEHPAPKKGPMAGRIFAKCPITGSIYVLSEDGSAFEDYEG